jgi:serine/threonine protein kinase
MTALEARERDHDLLSFMSLIIRTHKTLDTALTLLSIAIDDASIDIEVRSEKGGYFAVYLAPSKQLLAARFWRLDADALLENRTLPALVAVKIPQPNGNRDRDRKLWSSMAMELQILRNEYLRNHPNIVALFGVCWKTFRDGTLMPSFVLEAAECDLEKFLSGGDQVDRRTLFGLSEDIISGIRALHHVGIIHGDIKPTNVLIFKDSQVTFTAKIADFGSSLLLSDIRRRMRVSTGTGFWQAPEVRDLLHGLQLMQADVYSLGLVLWRLLGGDVMYDVLDAAAKAAGTTRESYFENLKSTDQSRIPELALQTLTSLSRPRAAKEWSQGNGHGSAKTSASNDGTQSIDAMAKNIATTVSLALARPRDRLRVDQILLNVQQAVDQHLGRGQGEGHLKFGRNVEEQKSDPQDAVSIRNGGAVLEVCRSPFPPRLLRSTDSCFPVSGGLLSCDTEESASRNHQQHNAGREGRRH